MAQDCRQISTLGPTGCTLPQTHMPSNNFAVRRRQLRAINRSVLYGSILVGILWVIGAVWLYYDCCFFPTILSFVALLFFVAIAVVCAWGWSVFMKAAFKAIFVAKWAGLAERRRGT
jgi:hypothetical protein